MRLKHYQEIWRGKIVSVMAAEVILSVGMSTFTTLFLVHVAQVIFDLECLSYVYSQVHKHHTHIGTRR